jgi:hypothetical protein
VRTINPRRIAKSGTFVLAGRGLFGNPTPPWAYTTSTPGYWEYTTGAASSPVPASDLQLDFDGAAKLTVDGVTYTADGAPAGFTPTTNLKGHIDFGHIIFSGTTWGIEWTVKICNVTQGPSFINTTTGALTPVPLPDDTSWFDMHTLQGNLHGNTGTFYSGSPTTFRLTDYATNIYIDGNYVIEMFWWVLPDTTACGEQNTTTPQDSTSHLVLAAEAPAGYQAFNPSDPSDAPTPVITSIEPNHGYAGTTVKIWGTGFGDGATVTFDGAAATAITVVSKYQITCTAPTHALGGAVVVVTNPDGVSST